MPETSQFPRRQSSKPQRQDSEGRPPRRQPSVSKSQPPRTQESDGKPPKRQVSYSKPHLPRRQNSEDHQQQMQLPKSNQDSEPKYYVHKTTPIKPRKLEYVTVNNGYGSQSSVEMQDFIDGLNSIEITADTVKMCKNLGITENTKIYMAKMSYENTNSYMFSYNMEYYGTTWEASILENYEITPYMCMTDQLFNDVASMKWNIYIAYKTGSITDNIIKFIGIVSAIAAYFEQNDAINGQTDYNKIISQHTRRDIHLE